jgi:hypothetical protein
MEGFTPLPIQNHNEPPWASLARELSPIMHFEVGTQEFPTNFFFDGNRNVLDNGVPSTYPDVFGNGPQNRVIYSPDTEIYPGDMFDLNSWSDLGHGIFKNDYPYLELDANFNYKLPNWKIIIHDSDITTSTISGGTDKVLIGSFSNIADGLNSIKVYAHSTKDKNNAYHVELYQQSLTGGYYSESLSKQKESATVFPHAFDNEAIIGIQFWFYYVYHDDPLGDNRANDWWYFWTVYDETNFKPITVVYDFHHNLRAFKWEDNRVSKEDFHVNTYQDAGGHRTLYAPGGDTKIIDFLISLGFMSISLNSPNLDNLMDKKYNSPKSDNIFGIMIDLYGYDNPILGIHNKLASWRYMALDEWYGGDPYGAFDTSDTDKYTWNVKEFPNWVWIYDTSSNNFQGEIQIPSQQYQQIGYTSTGNFDNNIPNPSCWPTSNSGTSTNFPWLSNPEGGKMNKDTTKQFYISNVRNIWDWHGYVPMGDSSPMIHTKYEDGSPNPNREN